jgi:hypothetical protein
MTTTDKLTPLAELKPRCGELDDLPRPGPSRKLALADLEAALAAELNRIDDQINQIKTYLANVPAGPAKSD